MIVPWIKFAAREFLKNRVSAAQGLKTRVFDDWLPELDEALQVLPETAIFPHELFRMLMQMAEPNRRKIILVTECGNPVAVAGLRDRWGYWEPVTQWIVPGVLFPIKEGYLDRVLPALGLEVRVAWWRWNEPPPFITCTQNTISEPTFGVRCSEDFEAYWRENGHLKDIRKYRKRCSDFTLKINPFNGNEWTIRNWEAKWRPQGVKEMPDLGERLLVADYLQEKDLYYSLVLYDGEEQTAGATLLIHCNHVVAHNSFRNPKYNWHGAMSRLNDLIFMWAREMGFEGIDLGGSHDYKKEWAPENGMKWIFDICPKNIILEKKLRSRLNKFNMSF